MQVRVCEEDGKGKGKKGKGKDGKGKGKKGGKGPSEKPENCLSVVVKVLYSNYITGDFLRHYRRRIESPFRGVRRNCFPQVVNGP